MAKYGLEESVVDTLKNLFSKYPEVEEVVIYGSRAKGNFRPGSDIDLTLKGKKLNLMVINSIADEIDDLFLPYLFDLSIFNHIKNQDLLEHISRVGLVFYSREQ